MSYEKYISDFWKFSEDNKGKIKPTHIALYMLIVNVWQMNGCEKETLLPSDIGNKATGINNYNKYKITLFDLVEMKLIKLSSTPKVCCDMVVLMGVESVINNK